MGAVWEREEDKEKGMVRMCRNIVSRWHTLMRLKFNHGLEQILASVFLKALSTTEAVKDCVFLQSVIGNQFPMLRRKVGAIFF